MEQHTPETIVDAAPASNVVQLNRFQRRKQAAIARKTKYVEPSFEAKVCANLPKGWKLVSDEVSENVVIIDDEDDQYPMTRTEIRTYNYNVVAALLAGVQDSHEEPA